jgi:hypothetical protein
MQARGAWLGARLELVPAERVLLGRRYARIDASGNRLNLSSTPPLGSL